MVNARVCMLLAQVDQLQAAVRDASVQLVALFGAELAELGGDLSKLLG